MTSPFVLIGLATGKNTPPLLLVDATNQSLPYADCIGTG